MEFFTNIWNWIVENKDEIITVLTSVQFVTLITTVIQLFKSNKKSTTFVNTQEEMNKVLVELNKALEVINETNENTKKLIDTTVEQDKVTNDFIAEAKELLNTNQDKLNAMIDAQRNVWSTVKDENIRTNVNNILTNARYLETSNIVEMRNTIEKLEQSLINKTSEIQNEVTETVKQVKETVKPSDVMRA